MERLTEYHSGVAVIRDKSRHKEAMEVLAKHEDTKERKRKAETLKMDFPVLRNNEKRKEFLKGFREWLIWFEVPEANETYYRYNLPDGSSIVICEYHMWLEWKERDTAKKPIKTTEETEIRYTDSYRCPNCGGGFTGTGIADFCYHCGQRLDWSE